MIETRNIRLPNDSTLEVEILPGFLDRVRRHFGLGDADTVSDYHIRMFFFGVVKTAVDKAEHG